MEYWKLKMFCILFIKFSQIPREFDVNFPIVWEEVTKAKSDLPKVTQFCPDLMSASKVSFTKLHLYSA